MRLVKIACILTVLFLVAAPMIAAEAERDKVPDAKEQEKAEAVIKDLFKAEFAKTKAADKLELSNKLHQQGIDTKDDSASRYALLRLSMDLAAQAGDLPQAMKVAEELARLYTVNGAEVKVGVFEKLAPAVKGAEENKALTEDVLQAVREAIQADDFDTADRLLKVAAAAATKSKSVAVVSSVSGRTKDVTRFREQFAKVKEALATLEKKPTDAEANEIAGTYFCLGKGNWAKGLPMLVQAKDAKLKALADKDAAGPDTPQAQMEMGDAWYEYANGKDLDPASKPHTQLRALHWYEMALGGVTGLNKTKVEKRLAELTKVAEAYSDNRDGWLVIFRSADPTIWGKAVNKGRNDFAMDLSKVPEKIEFLKLTETGKGESVIVPITRDRLSKATSADGRYGWNGTNDFSYKGYHLGIYDTTIRDKKGDVDTYTPGPGQGKGGWGFGNRAFMDDQQGYAWATKPIDKTVFVIAVKAGPLTPTEEKKVLKK